MEKTNKFDKKAIYSDIKSQDEETTYFKYLGTEDERNYFRFIGGKDSYYSIEHSKYGISIGFKATIPLYIVPDEQLQELIKQGKIVEQ